MKIQKIIHQIWFQGEENIPKKLLPYHKSWVDKHPDYVINVWDEKRINKLLDMTPLPWVKELYNSYELMIQKIDLAKYLILYTYGGVYLDMDIKCLKSLNTILENNTYECIFIKSNYVLAHRILFFVSGYSQFYKEYLNNGVIMTEPKHDTMLFTLETAYKNRNTTFKHINNMMYIFITTGPICLSQAVEKYIKNKQYYRLRIISPDYFEPCDIKYRCEHVIGNHIYENSWNTPLEKKITSIYKRGISLYLIILIVILSVVILKL